MRRYLVSLLLLSVAALPAPAQELVVSAAASLRDVMEDVARSFQAETGHAVGLNFASSGQLAAQIQNGADVDVFISAADEQVDLLQDAGLLLEGSRDVVAGNELVLIVPSDADAPPVTLSDLASERVRRIAIGQPRTVPAGQYAVQALTSLNLLDRLNDRLVYAANVRHVLAYVAQGDADAGLVYRTDVMQEPQRVRVVATVDSALHEPIRYSGAVVKASDEPEIAKRFLDYLSSPAALETFRRHGFAEAPTSPTTQPSRRQ